MSLNLEARAAIVATAKASQLLHLDCDHPLVREARYCNALPIGQVAWVEVGGIRYDILLCEDGIDHTPLALYCVHGDGSMIMEVPTQ